MIRAYLIFTVICVAWTVYIGLGDRRAYIRQGMEPHPSFFEFLVMGILSCVPGLQVMLLFAGILYMASADDPISNFFRRLFNPHQPEL